MSGEDLLELTLFIALGFFLAVAFYESMSARDVLVARGQRLAHRISARWWVAGLVYLATVAVGIPLLIVVWALVLELALFLVGTVDILDSIAVLAVAVVGATRILAYVHRGTAHELAKLIPLALLLLLVTGDSFDLDAKTEALGERDGPAITSGMLVFLIALELSLRLLTDASHAVLRHLRSRHGTEGDLGVWQTLRTRISSSLSRAMPAPEPTDDPTPEPTEDGPPAR